MKADISDAPERVSRKHHKQNVFYTAICLVIGGLATEALTMWLRCQGANIDLTAEALRIIRHS